jgi:hypothetical protein
MSTTTPTRHLERQALAAHRHGDTWATFWPTVAAQVTAAEPVNREAYRALVGKLLHALVCGDDSGQRPAGDDEPPPWLADDQAGPDDSRTEARCLLPLRPMPIAEAEA